jgi:ATP synthase in type III secretion protein N
MQLAEPIAESTVVNAPSAAAAAVTKATNASRGTAAISDAQEAASDAPMVMFGLPDAQFGVPSTIVASKSEGLDYIINVLDAALRDTNTLLIKGRVIQVSGTIIKAVVPGVHIGELCTLRNPEDNHELIAEEIGFAGHAALLSPLGDLAGVSSATEVIPSGKPHMVGVGPNMLGRIFDGLGNPIDGKGPVQAEKRYPVLAPPPLPMARRMITKPISLGLRAIDGMLTCAEGQRMGIFAAAGGGKSTLLSCIVRFCEADVVVLGLIGERGREVREFIEKDLGPEGLKRSALVVATSDRPAMERLKAAYVATTIAEYFRDKGRRVLLLMDSVTRFARALREIGLAAGEPPTRGGFPPSVFATLPQLMERSGQSDKGSITALYTVLVEGDDMTEPVADETRSILDGHIILSRKLAAANHYPAIDALASISRVMSSVISKEHNTAASHLGQLMSKYQEVELLLKLGEYKAGSDDLTDEAVSKIDRINAFLRQGTHEQSTFEETRRQMVELCK